MELKTTILPLDRKRLLKELPASNGIYIFTNHGKPVYIGKSVNIKARVISHIENAKLDPKEAAIIKGADSLEFYITDNEFKALLLESQLIQTHKPRYNVRWRDDKSYLYIKITVKETYPKIFLSRKEDKDKKAVYFGPFPSVYSAEEIIRSIRRIFPFCTQKKITKQACFYSKIGQCNPCPNVIEKETDPVEKKKLIKLYRYHIKQVVRTLQGKSDTILQDMYQDLKTLTTNEKYELAIPLRDKIRRFEYFLQGRKIDQRGDEVFNQSEAGMSQLQHLLIKFFPDLPLPQRIECFDISNTSMKQGTASMVVMTEGIINKKEYRKFKIKNEKLESDFEMMVEVIGRRLKHSAWALPDLLVVDGGKPQVRMIMQVLNDLQVNIPLIGIAKHPDRFVIGVRDTPTIRPQPRNPGFTLVQNMRDESHRFAKKYHVQLRNKKFLQNMTSSI